MAHYDSLTKLPNRTLFNTIVEEGLVSSKPTSRESCVMFIDLDRLKILMKL